MQDWRDSVVDRALVSLGSEVNAAVPLSDDSASKGTGAIIGASKPSTLTLTEASMLAAPLVNRSPPRLSAKQTTLSWIRKSGLVVVRSPPRLSTKVDVVSSNDGVVGSLLSPVLNSEDEDDQLLTTSFDFCAPVQPKDIPRSTAINFISSDSDDSDPCPLPRPKRAAPKYAFSLDKLALQAARDARKYPITKGQIDATLCQLPDIDIALDESMFKIEPPKDSPAPVSEHQPISIRFFDTSNSNASDGRRFLCFPRDASDDASDETMLLVKQMSSTASKADVVLASNWLSSMARVGWDFPLELHGWMFESYTCSSIAEAVSISDFLRGGTPNCTISAGAFVSLLRRFGASSKYLDMGYSLVISDDISNCKCEATSNAPPIYAIGEAIDAFALMVAKSTLTLESEDIIDLSLIAVRMQLDSSLDCLKGSLQRLIVVLFEKLEGPMWDSIEPTLLEIFVSRFENVSTWLPQVLSAFSMFSPQTRWLRRELAFRWLCLQVSYTADIVPLRCANPNTPQQSHSHSFKIIDELLSSGSFVITDDTDYAALILHMELLRASLDMEKRSDQDDDSIVLIAMKLERIHKKIDDRLGAFLERTRAKDLIQRLYMSLNYSVVMDEGKGGVGGSGKQRSVADVFGRKKR